MKRKTDTNAGRWGLGRDALFPDHPCRRASLQYVKDVIAHDVNASERAWSHARAAESSYEISNGVYSGFSHMISAAWEWRSVNGQRTTV